MPEEGLLESVLRMVETVNDTCALLQRSIESLGNRVTAIEEATTAGSAPVEWVLAETATGKVLDTWTEPATPDVGDGFTNPTGRLNPPFLTTNRLLDEAATLLALWFTGHATTTTVRQTDAFFENIEVDAYAVGEAVGLTGEESAHGTPATPSAGAEALDRLLNICDHMTKHPHSGCDDPQPHPDSPDNAVQCGSCWPCLLSQLEQHVATVRGAS